jgi:hypothetical protein
MRTYATFLMGTVAGLCLMGAAQAAPARSPVPAADSYADLLQPVQNAQAVLIADDLAQARQPKPLLQLVQYHHHHHHHHHHHGFFPGFGVTIAPPAVYGSDCYWRRQVWVDRWGDRHVRRVRVCD